MIPQFRTCSQENKKVAETQWTWQYFVKLLYHMRVESYTCEKDVLFFDLEISHWCYWHSYTVQWIYIQNPFCTAKHFGLYPPCSALCEVKLWLGSLYFSWQNALQKWQMQQPALETQVSWGSWKWHCPEQFGGHTPAKIEDSVVKLQTTKIGISQIGCALRNSVAFVWKKWVQIRNITVQNFTWNEVISFWTTNTILWSLKTGWGDKTLEICANRMCDLQKVTAGPTISSCPRVPQVYIIC